MDQRFLSTARATAAPVEARAESTPVPTVSSSPRQPALRGEAAIPGLPADAGAGTRTEALRPVGRISLAVNFPQEGQVYHFKKLKGDAHLILWSVRPAAFERVAWLLVLAALLVIGALVRRMARPRVGAAPLPTRTTA